MKFQRFKRGSVVMVEFSPSMGSEIKGKHLAIVLTKNDSPNNGVLTVIPLNSKNKPYYVPIGNFFLNEAIPFLDKQLNEFIENIKNVTDEEKKQCWIMQISLLWLPKCIKKWVLTPMQWYKISPQSAN